MKNNCNVLLRKNALIIASIDMSHYEPKESAKQKDRMALNALQKLDDKEFYSVIYTYRISMFGYCPAIALTIIAKKLEVKSKQILCYKTISDVIGAFYAVVGYVSIVYKMM